ncbi:MAG: hypothetical protein FWE06_10055 [Oscillospiraceae bacterium]|nr:hypothetical protein [Oscillospiraceae bacterium]
MKKPIEWVSQIDGKDYSFSYEKVKGKHVLTANGVPIEVKASFWSMILGFDEGFMLDGKEARLVVESKEPDVVIDGQYVRSGKVYVKRPAWVLVFAVLCILIPIVSLGGAIPAVIGFCGAAGCVSVSKTTLSTPIRVLICTGITVLAWVLLFLLGIGLAMLLG